MAEASQEMSEGELFVEASNESDEREPTEEGDSRIGACDFEAEIEEYAQWFGLDLEKYPSLRWIPREAIKAPMPPGWYARRYGNDDFYFVNIHSGEFRWNHPVDDQYYEIFLRHKEKIDKGEGSEVQVENEREDEPEGHAKENRGTEESDTSTKNNGSGSPSSDDINPALLSRPGAPEPSAEILESNVVAAAVPLDDKEEQQSARTNGSSRTFNEEKGSEGKPELNSKERDGMPHGQQGAQTYQWDSNSSATARKVGNIGRRGANVPAYWGTNNEAEGDEDTAASGQKPLDTVEMEKAEMSQEKDKEIEKLRAQVYLQQLPPREGRATALQTHERNQQLAAASTEEAWKRLKQDEVETMISRHHQDAREPWESNHVAQGESTETISKLQSSLREDAGTQASPDPSVVDEPEEKGQKGFGQMANGGGNGELIACIKAMGQEIAALRADLSRHQRQGSGKGNSPPQQRSIECQAGPLPKTETESRAPRATTLERKEGNDGDPENLYTREAMEATASEDSAAEERAKEIESKREELKTRLRDAKSRQEPEEMAALRKEKDQLEESAREAREALRRERRRRRRMSWRSSKPTTWPPEEVAYALGEHSAWLDGLRLRLAQASRYPPSASSPQLWVRVR